MNVLSFDTETFLIGPGAIAPKMVCCSVAGEAGAYLVSNGDASVVEDLRGLFESGHILVGHTTSYDLAVIATSYPELEPLIWEKLIAGEITCTKIREKLLNLSTHGHVEKLRLPDGSSEKIKYHLATLELQYLGIDRSAEKTVATTSDSVRGDSWRLNYDTLDGIPLDKWPAGAIKYALDDAVGTLLVYEAQKKRVESMVGYASLRTEFFRTAVDFALLLITQRGMCVDENEFHRVQERVQKALGGETLEPLFEAGILRRGQPVRPYSRQFKKAFEILQMRVSSIDLIDDAVVWEPHRELLETEGIKFKATVKPTLDKKKLTALVEKTCKTIGIGVRKTEKDNTITDAEVIEELAPHDEVLTVYQLRQSLQKIVTTELPRMMWEGKPADRVHFRYDALKETGRTSSYGTDLYPSGNGQQVDPRVRPCFVPEEGCVLLSVDYNQLELATLGQTVYNIFGSSVHRDLINEGYDLHAYLGSTIAYHLHPDFRELCSGADAKQVYANFIECKGHSEGLLAKFFKLWRGLAKPVGLGYPGGLGPWTLLSIARKKPYFVDIKEIAAQLPEDQFKKTEQLVRAAKKYLGMSEIEFTWTPMSKALALAIKLREIWLDTFDMRKYFKHISEDCKDDRNNLGTRPDGSAKEAYCYTSPFGMFRAGCSYTSAANGEALQTPAAEGATTAVIETVRACRDRSVGSILYGCKAHPVNFVHDELILDIPEDDLMHERAFEVVRIMVESMKRVVPDIEIGAEPALMRRWNKGAESVFDNGRLVVWEPPELVEAT
jgi:hypothetical protein